MTHDEKINKLIAIALSTNNVNLVRITITYDMSVESIKYAIGKAIMYKICYNKDSYDSIIRMLEAELVKKGQK